MSQYSPRQGRPEAALAIWKWRSVELDSAEGDHRQRTRLWAGVQTLIGTGLGALIFVFGSRGLAIFVWCVSGAVLAVALASPDRLYPRLQSLLEGVGRVLGTALTWLLLVPLFYLFFAPFGLLLRPASRDRLERRFETGACTYWKKKPATQPTADAYRRQF